MNLLPGLSLIVILVSCSSINKTGDQKTDALLEHMAQDTKIIGKNWEERFTQDGFINGEYVAIGTSSTDNLDANNVHLKVNAEAMAVGNLLKSAPSDFKKVVERNINTLEGNEGSTTENQVTITEVRALRGLKSNFKDFQCVKKATPNQNLKYSFIKECRVLVRVKANKLMEAYDFTLESKYNRSKEGRLKEMIYRDINQRSSDYRKIGSIN